MPVKVAHKAGPAEGGYVRVAYRYDDGSTRTYLVDPDTKESVLESIGTARTNEDGSPLDTWWEPF